jgi:hypothetical protein
MTLEHRINKVLRKVKVPAKRKALREGIRAEMEHAKTIRWVKKNPEKSVDEALKRIAQDHIAEAPDYYQRLKAVEETKKKAHHKLKSPRIKLIGRRGKVRIYRIDDTQVRKLYTDWTMGGHSNCYPLGQGGFIPHNEVWIAGELGPPQPPLEEQLTMLHELREMRRMGELMKQGTSRADSYDTAHDESLAIEDKFRKAGGRGLKQALARERGWQGDYNFPRP